MDKLANLQVLRAAAAGAVLVGHVLAEAEHFFATAIPLKGLPWTRGVDLFFVISGAIIALIILRQRPSPGSFLTRRFMRVAPLYYMFTTVMVGVVLTTPGALKETGFEPVQILASYTFVPFERSDGRIAPVLSLGWTLNYEMFFYVLASAALFFKQPLRVLVTALTLFAFANLLQPRPAVLHSWTNPLILEFAFGVLLGTGYARGLRLSGLAAGILAAAGMLWLYIGDDPNVPRWIGAGGAATLITAAALYGPTPRWPVSIVRLGDASYALYLSHRFVLRAATLSVAPLLPAKPWAIAGFVAFTCAFAIGTALLVHRWLELPLLKRVKNKGTVWRAA